MTDIVTPPTDALTLDGRECFLPVPFEGEARRACAAGRSVVVTAPSLDDVRPRLSGVTAALLAPLVEHRVREALLRSGCRRVERAVAADGTVSLVGVA